MHDFTPETLNVDGEVASDSAKLSFRLDGRVRRGVRA